MLEWIGRDSEVDHAGVRGGCGLEQAVPERWRRLERNRLRECDDGHGELRVRPRVSRLHPEGACDRGSARPNRHRLARDLAASRRAASQEHHHPFLARWGRGSVRHAGRDLEWVPSGVVRRSRSGAWLLVHWGGRRALGDDVHPRAVRGPQRGAVRACARRRSGAVGRDGGQQRPGADALASRVRRRRAALVAEAEQRERDRARAGVVHPQLAARPAQRRLAVRLRQQHGVRAAAARAIPVLPQSARGARGARAEQGGAVGAARSGRLREPIEQDICTIVRRKEKPRASRQRCHLRGLLHSTRRFIGIETSIKHNTVQRS